MIDIDLSSPDPDIERFDNHSFGMRFFFLLIEWDEGGRRIDCWNYRHPLESSKGSCLEWLFLPCCGMWDHSCLGKCQMCGVELSFVKKECHIR